MAGEDKAKVPPKDVPREEDPEEIAKALSVLGLGSDVDLGAAKKIEEEKKEADKNVSFDFGDLINGHIKQDVVASKQIRVVFQTMNGEEEEWVNEHLSSSMGKAQAYVNSRYRNFQLTFGIVELHVGGKEFPLPQIIVDKETDVIDDDSVFAKLRLLRRSMPMTALGHVFLQYGWFLNRAHEMYMLGEVKNG